MVHPLQHIATNMGFYGISSLIGLIVGILFLTIGRQKKVLKIVGWLFTIICGLVILFFAFLLIIGPF